MPDVIQKQRKVLMNVQCPKYSLLKIVQILISFNLLVLQIHFNFDQFLKSQMHQNGTISDFYTVYILGTVFVHITYTLMRSTTNKHI